MEWWNSLDIFEKVVWGFALITSLIFLIQMIGTFMGMDSDSGLNADFSGNLNSDLDLGGPNDTDAPDSSPFQLFTFRNFINFFLGFSWTIIAFNGTIENRIVLCLVGTVAGAAIVTGVMYIFYSMSKLTESGNMDINNAVNKTGQVYLTIPAHKGGMGKLHIAIQGTTHELDAMTDGEALPTGSMARVLGIINNNILLVEKL